MILIADEQRGTRLPVRKIRALARAILEGEGLPAGSTISLAFVDDRTIRRINRRFLKHDFATDVISFALDAGEFEVVISTPYAAREAGRRKIPLEEELLRYVAHGILHLAGYDDRTPAKKKKMWKRQEGYLAWVR